MLVVAWQISLAAWSLVMLFIVFFGMGKHPAQRVICKALAITATIAVFLISMACFFDIAWPALFNDKLF